MMRRPFRDRRGAGRLLAAQLAACANRPDVLVLALHRGGVPVAYEVARALNAPLDVFLVRQLASLATRSCDNSSPPKSSWRSRSHRQIPATS
jgi:predicted phosphoribosyltransferase